MTTSFDQAGARTLRELARACKGLMSRARALQVLAEEGNPTSPIAIRAHDAIRFLNLALERLEVTDTSRPSSAPPEGAVGRSVDRLLTGAPGPRAPVAPAPVHASERSFSGHCRGVSVPELVAFLSGLGKSGVLRVTTLNETFSVVLRRGELFHAFSDNTPSGLRLGEILVAQKAITEEALFRFLRRHSGDKGRLGEALEKENAVSRDQLRYALEHQVQQMFHRLFTAQEAAFVFQEGEDAEPDSHLRMNVTHLLLESARQLDEKSTARLAESFPAAGSEGAAP